MAFTAESVSILNGQDVVDVNSAESIENIKAGDFLQIGSFPLVEIKQAYKNGQGQKFIQLIKAWELTTQNNQPAIVIPTSGEFRAAVKALQDANILVNDNQQALQDYQNNLGTVTFKKSDGTTTTVKTLKQIEADNQAQMNAYHPYPWAMRKVEFEAMRAANKEKYAASGFVHKGKRYLDTWNIGYIDSLYSPYLGSSVAPGNLFMGSLNANAVGDSKQGAPKLALSGVETQLEYISSPNKDLLNKIKFPPAEDGTRTYDSATGVSVTHATPALAFAAETVTNKVVTDRVDMWGFEAFLREISDSDPFVYKNGLIQSLATDINGVATVSDNVRPITYFAWYDGDATSRGMGVNWQTATEAQRIAIASDTENNMYFDDATGKFYQWCIRGRSIAGNGNGDWDTLEDKNRLLISHSAHVNTRVTVQGNLDLVPENDGNNNYLSLGNLSGVNKQVGAFSAKLLNTAGTINGECYFLVCGTVQRLNKGAYHPSFNPLGTKHLNDGTTQNYAYVWSNSSAVKINSKADCFGDLVTTNPNSGKVSGGISARPDGRYFDAIYASGQGGVCRDMRYSAWGLTAEDFAEQDLAIKAGEYRGREVLSITKFIPETVTVGGAATYTTANAGGTISFPTSDSDNPRNQDSVEFNALGSTHWLLAGDNDETMIIKRVSQLTDYVRWPYNNNAVYLYGSGDVTSEFNSKFPVGTKLWVGAMYPSGLSVSYEYLQTEIIGHPLHISACDDLKEGIVGSWNPTIPDGVIEYFKLTKPYSGLVGDIKRRSTTDNGATWSGSDSVNIASQSNNTVSYTPAQPANQVNIYQYKTKAKMTQPATVSEINGAISDVNYLFTSMDSLDNRGRLLNYSLTGLISTHAPVATTIGLEMIRLESLPIVPSTGNLYGSNIAFGELRHSPLSLGAPSNDSPAFKALNYNVAKNQQGFINYAYAQLTYDATAGDWGDDGKIHIADNQTTMLDENGHTNLVGTACGVEPLGWL